MMNEYIKKRLEYFYTQFMKCEMITDMINFIDSFENKESFYSTVREDKQLRSLVKDILHYPWATIRNNATQKGVERLIQAIEGGRND